MISLVKLAFVLAFGAMVDGAYNPLSDPTSCCDCNTLLPFNTPANTQPQRVPSPFHIVVSRTDYAPLEEVQVNLTADEGQSFRSFLIVAWKINHTSGSREVVGSFTALNGARTEKYCMHGLKSSSLHPKSKVKLVWTNEKQEGHFEFRATFIVDDYTYWAREKSVYIIDTKAPPLPKTPPLFKIIDPINTAPCGSSKGCYREPEGCWELYCYYIFTWQDLGSTVRFEIGGLTDGLDDRYISVALSNDTYMGDDMVMDCIHNSEVSRTDVSLSHNEPGSKHNERLPQYLIDRAILQQEGSHYNGRIRCRFIMDKYAADPFHRIVPLTGNVFHIMMARGYAVQGRKLRHGLQVHDLPIVSPGKVSLQTFPDIHDRARYPLVKAHGCLMLIAFVFCASIALLMTKYYKPMWPNRRIFSQRYWFMTHFNLMAMCFLLVIIAFILIFIEAGGYSRAPDLPQKAHPILGIIIFVCIIINPILALLRPSEDNKCRPVFNWFHWAFGTIANVLAIPNMFIGMDFGKAMVPWWATWILVIWVIFHLIIEVSLEVHQCCTHKKNKERRKKYELQKRENPKLYIPEPEPAGRRFKRFMLFLHVTVTTIITLIMVIVIAVS